ncbi:hypothetical protein [Shinella sp. JR1-6]|uniref:hypothetical protein n=1 Tax=Shinella sp. JR1-6 TaxID=2527671 RepID=UPI00102D61E4|nr:hypothetical protein [Shinella sp. JR1-6]TAA54608.1 hypothetical protein EXZ48_26650 [Shinella sp. JR1-6]
MANLTDAQWCVLDLLLRAKNKGVSRVNRHELLHAAAIPDAVKLQLVFAALTLASGEYVALHGQHDFEITPAGETLFNAKFGQPSNIADTVIALPDGSREVLQ